MGGLTDDLKVGNGGGGEKKNGEKKGGNMEFRIENIERPAGKEDKVGVESDKIFAGTDTFVVADQKDLDNEGNKNR